MERTDITFNFYRRVCHHLFVTTVAHMISGSLIGIAAAGVIPSETWFIAATVISSGLLDIDHAFLLIKNRSYFKKSGYKNTLHKARSFMHELLGFFVIGLAMLLISFFNVKLTLVIGIPAMVHLTEDLMMGVSIPFNPIDKTEISLIPQRNRIKVAVDVLVVLISGFLWIIYLTGQN